MQIEGPFTISIVDNTDTQTRELQLSFTAEFQAMEHDTRVQNFSDHIQKLNQDIQAATDAESQQGMITILQICEQLLPHIDANEIPLEETIAIDIGPSSPFDQLLDSATLK